MTGKDTDGADLMMVWGPLGPPRHPDGSPVVTPRLRAKMTDLELMMYSGDDLRVHLARRVHFLTDGEPIDGRDPEDFVAYGLERAARYESVTRSAVSFWVQKEISDARNRASSISIEPLYPEDGSPVTEPEDPGYTPITLPDDWTAWIDDRLPGRRGRAVKLFAEGLTATEAAGTVGITRQSFYEALDVLREEYR